jgi:hypothetical protein
MTAACHQPRAAAISDPLGYSRIQREGNLRLYELRFRRFSSIHPFADRGRVGPLCQCTAST